MARTEGKLEVKSDDVATHSAGVGPRRVFLSLALVCLAAFAAASLASHHAGDPPYPDAFPVNPQPQNWCGLIGAALSRQLLDFFGDSSFLLCLALFQAAMQSLAGRPRRGILAGVILLHVVAVGAATLAQMTNVTLLHNPPAGPGGLVGSLGKHHLIGLFSFTGSLIVVLPLTTAALLFGVDRSVRRIVGTFFLALVWRVRLLLNLQQPNQRVGVESAPAVVFHGARTDLEWSPSQAVGAAETVVADVPAAEGPITPEPDPGPLVIFSQAKPATPEKRTEPKSTLAKTLAIACPYALPAPDLLAEPEPFNPEEFHQEVLDRAKLLERTFAEFQMKVKVVQIDTGPVVTQYEIELEPGLRARRVTVMTDDVAIALRAPTVRMVAPIPGKNTVGIEIPNERRAKVTLKEVMAKGTGAMRLPLFLGKDVKGQPLVCDLATMPHLLIGGATGTGKSVCLNSMILSILMTKTPDEVKMLMIDPKMVELSLYKDVPHLLHPVVTDMKKAETLLAWAVEKMEERYSILARVGVRQIDSYNRLTPEELYQRFQPVDDEEREQIPTHLPYIVIFADELADLMMTSAKEVEAHIIRLAQKSRAVGIHLVVATQKPTVNVITGLIKSNLPARLAFKTASRKDSEVILDAIGAEKLLGNGDMLFLYPGTSRIIRAQGAFVSDEEVHRVTEHLSKQARPQFAKEIVEFQMRSAAKNNQPGDRPERDDLYDQAVDWVVREQRGSVSLLQRALGIGYGRAARMIDWMAQDGIVGEYNGSQAREVLFNEEQWAALKEARFQKAS